MDNNKLLGIESRISILEKRLLPSNGDADKACESIKAVDETLNAFASRRERFKQVFKRVPDICEYLSPGFVDAIQMDTTCEQEAVLAAEDTIRQMAAQLEEVQKYSKRLDGNSSKEFSKHQSELAKLQTVQQKQLEDLDNLSEDLTTLISTYNHLVNYLSESFVKWDLQLSKLEEEKENQE